MKKLSTYLFLILFSFSAPSFADDISEFQIEGMSIGYSLLDYFSELEIKNNKRNYVFKNNKFYGVGLENLTSFEIYDTVVVYLKTDDKKYLTHAIHGVINYAKNIKDCYKKMDEIVLEMSDTFKNIAKKGKKDIERDPRYTGDPTGKTIVTRLSFWFDNDDRASISCYDYSEEHGGLDNLTVGVQTKEQNDFLLNKAYK